MIISLPFNHPAVPQLQELSVLVRSSKRNEITDLPTGFENSLRMQETVHGAGCFTYIILPGRADDDEAISTYQYLRNMFPKVLDILCFAASKNMREIAVEISPNNQDDTPTHSNHDLLMIMPRVISFLRGGANSE